MQNYGFENGFPGSLYNQGMKAKWAMQDYMADRMETALQEELERGSTDLNEHTPSIISKFIMCLEEEGYDVFKDGSTRFRPTFAVLCAMFTAGAARVGHDVVAFRVPCHHKLLHRTKYCQMVQKNAPSQFHVVHSEIALCQGFQLSGTAPLSHSEKDLCGVTR